MKRSIMRVCLLAVISLMPGAIWQASASAAVAPVIESLGQIRNSQVLAAPGRIDVDAAGNIYVTDARKAAVVKFDKYGQWSHSFTGMPVAGTGLAVTPDGKRIYVAGQNLVTILDGVTGDVVGRLGSGVSEFDHAGEVDLDAAGYVFVADSGSKFIKVYDVDGGFQYQFGGFGINPGQFQTIWALSVNEQAGEVYAADVQSYQASYPKVQVFGLDGTLRRSLLATTGFGPKAMTFFGGFTFDRDGRAYFPDSFRNDVRVLGLPATYLYTFAQSGYDVGQLNGPLDAVFDPSTSRLFVVCDGGRIEIFGIDGGQNPVAANDAPGVPVPLSPVAESEVASATPRLVFQNATDPDGDVLTYDVRVFDGETLTAEYLGLPEGEETSFAQVDSSLEENGLYGWTVRSFDGEDASGWAPLQSFYVNALEESPSVPILSFPLAGEALDGEGLLSWKSALDPDPFDEVGYILQVAENAAFSEILLDEAVAGTSVKLSDLAGYSDLQDGMSYFWRVKAVDNHGVASEGSEPGTFLYDTTLLKVTSNIPGAKVYLGGNHGYVGRYLGEAPMELRDFPVGVASLMVERAGFEPYAVQVNPQKGENVVVYAKLASAIAPADLKARPLEAAGADINLGSDSAPFAVDFDNDGLTDLLAADASGALTLYKKVLTAEGVEYYSQGVAIAVPLIPGASPFVVDWNDDGRKDLLIGGDDGTVTLLLNTGSENAPAFDGGSLLQASGVPIAVGAAAVPAVIDIDSDGDKDLLIGSASGAVRLYRNYGSDEVPQLSAAANLVSLSSPVAPFFVDWDGDGVRELLVAASEHLYLYERKDDGVFAPLGVLTVGSDLLNNNNGTSANGAFSIGDRLRVFAFDADGSKGKDLIIGNAAGEIRLVVSHGNENVAAFSGALLDKVSQIDQMVRQSTPELVPVVDEIRAAIELGNLKTAGKSVRALQEASEPGTDLAFAAGELAELL